MTGHQSEFSRNQVLPARSEGAAFPQPLNQQQQRKQRQPCNATRGEIHCTSRVLRQRFCCSGLSAMRQHSSQSAANSLSGRIPASAFLWNGESWTPFRNPSPGPVWKLVESLNRQSERSGDGTVLRGTSSAARSAHHMELTGTQPGTKFREPRSSQLIPWPTCSVPTSHGCDCSAS